MSEFNQDLAMQLFLLKDEHPFSVSLDDAWQWLGYTRKDSAKDKLLNNFDEGDDYIRLRQEPESVNHEGSSPQEAATQSRKETIMLNVDCFKQLGMMAGTSKGKEVRRYFLNCEKILKQQQSLNTGNMLMEMLHVKMNEFIEHQQHINQRLIVSEKAVVQLDDLKKAGSKHPGFMSIIEGEMEINESIGLTVKTYCQARGVKLSRQKAIQMGQIASAAYKIDKKSDPIKAGANPIYYGNDIRYLEEAFTKVTQVDLSELPDELAELDEVAI